MKKSIKIKFIGFQSKNYINGLPIKDTWFYKTLEKIMKLTKPTMQIMLFVRASICINIVALSKYA